jgi:hypothetical protein
MGPRDDHRRAGTAPSGLPQTWGQGRIANELRLKLGVRVSPRTVRKYIPKPLGRGRHDRPSFQHRQIFVRNHGQVIIVCDVCVVVTATFRLLYVVVLMEHATRRILHINVTEPPTAHWTLNDACMKIRGRTLAVPWGHEFQLHLQH